MKEQKAFYRLEFYHHKKSSLKFHKFAYPRKNAINQKFLEPREQNRKVADKTKAGSLGSTFYAYTLNAYITTCTQPRYFSLSRAKTEGKLNFYILIALT